MFGGLGASNTFGQPQTQQPQPQQPQQGQGGEAALYQSVMQVQLFNDTRDGIIAKLNMLQASWGQGKAFYSNQAQPLTLAQDNPLCRFKAVGYSVIPRHDNAEGLVSIAISKKVSEVEAGKTQFVSSLTQLLGNKPGLTVNVEAIKESGETCEVVITVSENVNGQLRKTPAQDLSNFLQSQAAQLKVYSVTGVYPKLGFSKKELEEYLATAPSGVDPRLWKQAVVDNPSPDQMIPVPLIGFKSLQARISAQESQNKAQCGRLDVLAQEIETLKKKQADAIAALTEAKRKEAELAHRVLRVMVGQESRRKVGYTISREEEQLFSQLESVAAELATPTQFRGRLQELLSCVRLQSQVVGGAGGEKYSLDTAAVSNIKEVLTEQQRGIQVSSQSVQSSLVRFTFLFQAMMQVVKDDFNDLDLILQRIKK